MQVLVSTAEEDLDARTVEDPKSVSTAELLLIARTVVVLKFVSIVDKNHTARTAVLSSKFFLNLKYKQCKLLRVSEKSFKSNHSVFVIEG